MNARPRTSELMPPELPKPSASAAAATRSEKGARLDCFPTAIWRFHVAGHEELNRKLLQLADDERGRDPLGIGHRSSVLGWHSKDQLHRRPEMQDFLGILHDNIAEVS